MLKDEVLDKTIPVPLYFQLKTLIKNKIKDGTYKSGDLIPTENELSDMFGISRTTVRQAVTELVHEGYLYRIKSKTASNALDDTFHYENYVQQTEGWLK